MKRECFAGVLNFDRIISSFTKPQSSFQVFMTFGKTTLAEVAHRQPIIGGRQEHLEAAAFRVCDNRCETTPAFGDPAKVSRILNRPILRDGSLANVAKLLKEITTLFEFGYGLRVVRRC